MLQLKDLVEENSKLLRFIQHTQEYNPSSEIDDIMVCNISKTLKEHRYVGNQNNEQTWLNLDTINQFMALVVVRHKYYKILYIGDEHT